MIYFDNAATTLVSKDILEEMLPFFSEEYGNPSSVYALGRSSKAAVERVRKEISLYFKCSADEIYFVSSATEAHNIVFSNVVNLGVDVVITSKLEHAAVLNPLNNQKDVIIFYVDHNDKGELDLSHLEQLLVEYPNALVSLMHINNELGNINDANAISSLCVKYGAKFHCDTVQSIGHSCNLDFGLFDFAVGSAHKFHGPKGIGFLYIKKGNNLAPVFYGGKQEAEFRAGTENVPGIVGLGKALAKVQQDGLIYLNHIKDLKKYFLHQLDVELPTVNINGGNNTCDHIVSLSFKSSKINKMFLFTLDLKGFAVSGGSACSSGAVKSHVAEAIGVPDDVGYVRVSFSRYNTKSEIDSFVDCLKSMI